MLFNYLVFRTNSSFSLPDQTGNIAEWSENAWEFKTNEYQRLEMELSSMCKAEKGIVLPEMGFSFFRHTCKVLHGQPLFVKNLTYHQRAVEIMNHAQCGMFFIDIFLSKTSIYVTAYKYKNDLYFSWLYCCRCTVDRLD